MAYTVVHLLPVLGVLVLRLALGRRLDPVLGAAFAFLGRWGGPAAGVLAVAAGLALAVLGVRALAG